MHFYPELKLLTPEITLVFSYLLMLLQIIEIKKKSRWNYVPWISLLYQIREMVEWQRWTNKLISYDPKYVQYLNVY